VNDFEQTVLENHPEISILKDLMYDEGASYAAMSGSGSTVFGIFPNTLDISRINKKFSKEYDHFIHDPLE